MCAYKNHIAQTLTIWLDGSGLPDAVRIERRAAVPMQLHYVSHWAMEASRGGKLPPAACLEISPRRVSLGQWGRKSTVAGADWGHVSC